MLFLRNQNPKLDCYDYRYQRYRSVLSQRRGPSYPTHGGKTNQLRKIFLLHFTEKLHDSRLFYEVCVCGYSEIQFIYAQIDLQPFSISAQLRRVKVTSTRPFRLFLSSLFHSNFHAIYLFVRIIWLLLCHWCLRPFCCNCFYQWIKMNKRTNERKLGGPLALSPTHCCLSERLVMYDGYPYSVSGKLTQFVCFLLECLSESIGVYGTSFIRGDWSPLPTYYYFFPIACTKIKWICPNIIYLIFCPKMAIWKFKGGGGPPSPPPPPAPCRGRTPMSERLVM